MNICFLAKYGFLELNGHCILKIVSSLWSVRVTSVAAAITAKEHIEYIAESTEVRTAAATHALVRVNMAEAIIGRLLLVIT
ncbi:hypothetical protein D3C73_1388880 [compost metagenome]